MQVSLESTLIEVHAFRRKGDVPLEDIQCIIPDVLLLPPPPSTLGVSGSSKNVSSKETSLASVSAKIETQETIPPAAVVSSVPPKHPLTALAATGTILAVNLELVASDFHLQSAIFRAQTYTRQKKSKTKTPLTEILYQLANTGNINEAIRQYFVTEETTEFVLLRIADDEGTKALYGELVNGLKNHSLVEEFSLSDINDRIITDEVKREQLKKLFKLSQFESGPSTIHDSIITKLALKDM